MARCDNEHPVIDTHEVRYASPEQQNPSRDPAVIRL
jgi:hypothetical protein